MHRFRSNFTSLIPISVRHTSLSSALYRTGMLIVFHNHKTWRLPASHVRPTIASLSTSYKAALCMNPMLARCPPFLAESGPRSTRQLVVIPQIFNVLCMPVPIIRSCNTLLIIAWVRGRAPSMCPCQATQACKQLYHQHMHQQHKNIFCMNLRRFEKILFASSRPLTTACFPLQCTPSHRHIKPAYQFNPHHIHPVGTECTFLPSTSAQRNVY